MSWVSVSLAGGVLASNFVRKTGDQMSGELKIKGAPLKLEHAETQAGGKISGAANYQNRSEGHLLLDVDVPYQGVGPHIARMRVFRLTNVGTDAVIEVFRGDGTGTLAHRIAGRGNAYFAVGGGRVAIGHTEPSVVLDVGGSDGVALPQGTTAQRPEKIGAVRYNSETGKFEGKTANGWVEFGQGGIVEVEQFPRYEIVEAVNNATIQPGHAYEQLEVVGGKIREVVKTIEVSGAGNVVLNLPASGVSRGMTFVVVNRATGALTIQAPAGSTVNGGSSVVVPWQDGVVFLEAAQVGSGISWVATGDTEAGVELPRTVVRGELVLRGFVSGGRRKTRPTISAATTLDPVEDVGVIRRVSANVAVTVPAAFRGQVDLVFEVGGTVVFEGGASKTIGSGKRAIVDVHEVGGNVYRAVYEATPL